jgi:hypothetical protein
MLVCFPALKIFCCVQGDYCTLQSIAFIRLCMAHWLTTTVVLHRWWQTADMKAQLKKAFNITKVEFADDNEEEMQELDTALRLRFLNMVEIEGLKDKSTAPEAAAGAPAADGDASDDDLPL